MTEIPTCWTMLESARAGDPDARGTFAATYLAIVRAFLFQRWRNGPGMRHLDDAVQEVFLDFLRDDGALARLDKGRTRNFRTFLFGVTLQVARRWEERARNEGRRRDDGVEPERLTSAEASISRQFDRAWAQRLVARARERLARTVERDAGAQRRHLELLQLRFGEGLPIREIARRWGVDPAQVHHEYARARAAFKKALLAEVAFHHRGTDAEIEAECRDLLESLRE